jgi:membrane associated rhomboid family serine protease
MIPRLTPSVKWLAISCLAAFVIQKTADEFLGGNLLSYLALTPNGFLGGKLWTLITYSFLHGDPLHLFLNLLMLVFIGGELEMIWGLKRFLRFYFFCVVVAGLCYLLLQFTAFGGNNPLIGASGGIYGLLMAYGILFSERVLLFMMLFPMKAKHFVWVLAAVEFLSGLFSGRSGLSAVAHLGGMAAGFGYLTVAAQLSLRSKSGGRAVKKKPTSSHLKLVVSNDAEQGKPKKNGPKTFH